MSRTAEGRAWVDAALARYERPLIRYALAITGDLERARDVVQDTFLRLCCAPREKVQTHLAAWLFTVCRNRARDIRRKEGRMGTVETKELESRESPEPLPSAELEKRESLSGILKALEELPANQREVLRLKFQNDLSYREISEITALSVSNVGFLIHRGLRTLREKLQEERARAGSRRIP